MSGRAKHRWRGLQVEHRGWRVAAVEERGTGRTVRVYHRLGRWRFYANDKTIRDAALIGCARRLLGKET